MRRRGITVLIIAVIAAAFVGTYSLAYRAGETSGRNKVSTDRSQFQTRIAANPQSGGAGGAPPGGAGGSAAAGSGAQRPGGGPGNATGASGTPAAGGSVRPAGAGVGTSVAGRVTKVDGATVSVTQTDNSTVSVATNGETAIRKLVTGALTDLKTGDIVTVDGAKTSDTAYNAKTITSLGQVTGATAAGSGRPNAAPPGVPGPAVTGQIKNMDGGTIMVQGFDGATVTVTSSPATVVKTQQPGTLSDIKTGDVLFVLGDKTGDNAFLARSITDQGASPG